MRICNLQVVKRDETKEHCLVFLFEILYISILLLRITKPKRLHNLCDSFLREKIAAAAAAMMMMTTALVLGFAFCL